MPVKCHSERRAEGSKSKNPESPRFHVSGAGDFAFQAKSLQLSHDGKKSFHRDIRLWGFLFLVRRKWSVRDLVPFENKKMVGNFLEASFFFGRFSKG